MDGRRNAPPGAGGERPGWQVRTARVLTEALAPSVLAVVVPVVVGAATAASAWRGAGLGALAAVFSGGLPHLLVVRGVRRGTVGDRHVRRREERPVLLGLTVLSLAAGLLLLLLLGAPHELFALLAAMVAGVAVALVVSLWWKVSLHAAVVAGSVAVLVPVLGPGALALTPLVVATAWSRVVLGAHTRAQVVVGALVGAVVAGAVMAVL